jgi:glutamyl-tRNA synthetase
LVANGNEQVRVRIAPSPTGDPHVGTAYIALFNYAFSKKNGGKFILRIEDTDRFRSTKESEAAIINALSWLGINWDEGPDVGGAFGPYRQSERADIYQKYADKLLNSQAAYRCICTSERLDELRKRQHVLKQPTGYDGRCRMATESEIETAIRDGASYVVRLKTPSSGEIVMHDVLRGEIVISCTEVDDQILMKSDGFPTYHLANVVDDYLMGITHVIRGEEWISSLPKHVLLYEAFGFKKPQFCHLPLLRNADKSKVSKRKNPVSLNYFKEAGFLSQALLNFLGLMAYSMPDGHEFFFIDEFIEHFQLQRISLGGPVFDIKKLIWLNGRYLRETLSDSDWVKHLQEQLFNREYLGRIVPLIKERVLKSEDFLDATDFFFRGEISCDPIHFLIGNLDYKISANIIDELLEHLESLAIFDSGEIGTVINEFCKSHQLKMKDVLMPIRMMLCGKKISPPMFDTIAVLGKERCRVRLRAAILAMRKMIV